MYTKLFTYFSGVMCNDRKKLILDIERQTTRNYIKDIVDQMIKVDRVTDGKMFCMPYDYELKKFETEDSRVTKVIEKGSLIITELHNSLQYENEHF